MHRIKISRSWTSECLASCFEFRLCCWVPVKILSATGDARRSTNTGTEPVEIGHYVPDRDGSGWPWWTSSSDSGSRTKVLRESETCSSRSQHEICGSSGVPYSRAASISGCKIRASVCRMTGEVLEMTDNRNESTCAGEAKKPYNSPVLQVYGDFREITNSSTKTGTKTDDAHPTPRTR